MVPVDVLSSFLAELTRNMRIAKDTSKDALRTWQFRLSSSDTTE